MKYTLHGARLIDGWNDLARADLRVDDTRIQAVHALRRARGAADRAQATAGADAVDGAGPRIDLSGMILVPGFVEVHTHGGGGHNLHTANPAEIVAFSRWVAGTGVTSYLVGVVGSPNGLPVPQVRAAVDAIEGYTDGHSGDYEGGAEPLGIHLEGPYLSELRRGAHLATWLRTPDPAETEQLLDLAVGHLRIITLAPELPGAAALIRRVVAAGVTASIGHTDATYEQACEAIRLGATHTTHCCNAMRPLHHRDPGPLSAVSEVPRVYGELIADGLHVHPAMMRLIVKLLGPERIVVITDALAGAGMPDTAFEFAGQQASVVHGVARLADGTITGSVLTMDQALRNVLEMTGVSLQDAVGMLTRNPAQAAGAAERKGRLAAGFDADLALFDQTLTLQATICRGRVVYVTDEWRERLAPLGAPSGRAAGAPAPAAVIDREA
jgi:N-acetylglucosamine-6-phosphate deacetylase